MENKKRKVEIVILVIITLLVIAIGVSYALWVLTKEQTGENVVSTSCLNVTIENEADDISLKNTFPILDEEGLNSKPYKFTIKNNCEEYADYKISLEMLGETTINSEYIKIALSEEGDKGVGTLLSEYDAKEELTVDGAKEGRQIKRGKLKPSEEKKYELRIWINEDVTKEDGIENEIYKSKIVVESVLGDKPYTESILHGTDPVLDGKLIPIKINEEDGSVTRADETKKWYSYGEQQWANAVILRDGIEDPGANEPIEESDIESYFVWIPKYRYRLFDLGEYETSNGELDPNKQNEDIEIEFTLENTINDKTDECSTPTESGEKGSCDIGKWMTHPAFLAFNTKGIWVGKFEAGYKEADSETFNIVNGNASSNVTDATKLVVKPNVYAWRSVAVGNSFKSSKEYNSVLRSHLIKNTEYGAVAYLTQSVYGRCTNSSCDEVSPNRNPSYLTGYTNTESYFSNSFGASSTNNKSGVYDMREGVWEQTAGVLEDKINKTPILGDSGLTLKDLNDERFYDLYDYYDDTAHYNRRILGDATGELGPFKSYIGSMYNSESSFFASNQSWLYRGKSVIMPNYSSIFVFQKNTGLVKQDDGFRIALAVN